MEVPSAFAIIFLHQTPYFTGKMGDPQPLVLCMENAAGEEVTLSVEHNDNFQTFLDKAK